MYHGSTHVSKPRYFCALLINVIALKRPLKCGTVVTLNGVVSRGRMTDDQNSQKISVVLVTLSTVELSVVTLAMHSTVDDFTTICIRN